MNDDYSFEVDNCCTPGYGSVWLDSDSLCIGASPHACHVTINTVDQARQLIAAAHAFIRQQDPEAAENTYRVSTMRVDF